MIYKIREIYPIKFLLMFYNSFGKSISHGILTYGSEAKDNLYKIEKAQRRKRAIFFRKKYDTVGYIFERNKIMTVFEIYLMELSFRRSFQTIENGITSQFTKYSL